MLELIKLYYLVLFMSKLNELGIKCSICSDEIVCDFDKNYASAFPNIYFKISGQEFIIKPERYIYHTNYNLYLLIASTDTEVVVLGQPFLRDYYTVFYAYYNYGYIYFYPLYTQQLNSSLVSYIGSFASLGIIAAIMLKVRAGSQSNDYKRII